MLPCCLENIPLVLLNHVSSWLGGHVTLFRAGTQPTDSDDPDRSTTRLLSIDDRFNDTVPRFVLLHLLFSQSPTIPVCFFQSVSRLTEFFARFFLLLVKTYPWVQHPVSHT